MKPLPLLICTASILLLVLTGCSSTPKPPIAQISLNVQEDINFYRVEANVAEARPVVIRLYELTSLAAFNSTDFLSIFNDFQSALGNELLFSEEFRLVPGMRQKFKRPLNLDTRYIGVVAAFRDLENAQWKAFTPVPAQEKEPEIYIFLKENQILIGAKEPCGFFCRMRTPKPEPGTLYEVIE